MSIRFLSGCEWHLLRDARLAALRESPRSFLSSYDRERGFPPERWREELGRGAWLVSCPAAEPEPEPEVEAVLGATAEPDVDASDRYLSYLWVAPPARGRGIGRTLVETMLDHLRTEGVARAWLWVLEGNEAAVALYRNLGFLPTGDRQPLRHDPSRFEERLSCELG